MTAMTGAAKLHAQLMLSHLLFDLNPVRKQDFTFQHALTRRCDRPAVLEFDLHRLERAAFGAAVQRIDHDLDLVAGLEAPGAHTVSHQHAGSAAFEKPFLGDTVL